MKVVRIHKDAFRAAVFQAIRSALVRRNASRLQKIKADLEKASLQPETREMLDRSLRQAFSDLGITTE